MRYFNEHIYFRNQDKYFLKESKKQMVACKNVEVLVKSSFSVAVAGAQTFHFRPLTQFKCTSYE